jgi:hypothetical protein
MAGHRHQASLESIISFSNPQILPPDQRSRAQQVFYLIVTHFDQTDDTRQYGYKRPLLVRYTHEYSLSDSSQDVFLRAFFDFLNLDVTNEDLPDLSNVDVENQLHRDLNAFGDFLLDNFFLPSQNPPPPSLCFICVNFDNQFLYTDAYYSQSIRSPDSTTVSSQSFGDS